MDFYEALVETYLTVVEGCAVIPQAPIREDIHGNPWEAYLDFVAINFQHRRIEVIEVSKASSEEASYHPASRRKVGWAENLTVL